MEYDVTLVLTLFSKNRTHFASSFKELKLPFVPYIGLSFLSGPINFGEIIRVMWIEEEKRFSCSIDRESQGGDDDLEFLIKMAVESGYQEFGEIHEV